MSTTPATADKATVKLKTITEGSVKMCYPADQEQAVFYNPVQVQNRDLSILMITLAAERRAIRRAVVRRKKELRPPPQQPQDAVENGSNTANANGNANDTPASTSSIKEQLAAYQVELEKNPSAALQQYQESSAEDGEDDGLTILDALAASGLRSMRYWREIPGVKHVTINDLDPAAVERAHTNLLVNELTDVLVANGTAGTTTTDQHDPRARGIRIQHGDATHEMYSSRKPNITTQAAAAATSTPLQPPYPQWAVIDLDPYGSAAPFLDGAVQAVQDGGLLCITCTDMAALGGSHPETCFGRYASMPIPRAGYLQELAVRILLQSTASSAARYGRSIKPILSVGMDFYVRVFVEVYKDKAAVHAHSLNIGNVYQSTQCPSFIVAAAGQMGGKKNTCYQPGRVPTGACQETGAAFKIGGPFWLGPLHDVNVVKEALQRLGSKDETTVPAMKWIATRERLRGLLMSCRDELNDAPLFYKLPDLAQALAASTPPLALFKAALVNAGYRVSGYHKEPQAIKTNAPNSVVWDIMRTWCKANPPLKAPKAGSVAEKILAVEPSIIADFSIPKSMKYNNEEAVARFPMNPEPNWGPKAKASGHKRKAEDNGKTC